MYILHGFLVLAFARLLGGAYQEVAIPHGKESLDAVLVLAVAFGEGVLVLDIKERHVLEHPVYAFRCLHSHFIYIVRFDCSNSLPPYYII